MSSMKERVVERLVEQAGRAAVAEEEVAELKKAIEQQMVQSHALRETIRTACEETRQLRAENVRIQGGVELLVEVYRAAAPLAVGGKSMALETKKEADARLAAAIAAAEPYVDELTPF